MNIRALGIFVGIQSVTIAGVLSLTASPGLTANVWKDIWERIVRSGGQEKPRSVRGGICLVGPSAVIWSDRPRLAWDGNVNEIKIFKSDDLINPIWIKNVDIKQSSIQYNDKPLKPGVYQWEAIDVFGRSKVMLFEVMENDERGQIATEFTTLTEELNNNKVIGDDRALQKIDFWLKQDLPWDAMSVVYGDEGRSPETEKLQQDFVDKVCQLKPMPINK
jgi:hypothetical protein